MGWVNKDSNIKMYQTGGQIGVPKDEKGEMQRKEKPGKSLLSKAKKKYETGDDVTYFDETLDEVSYEKEKKPKAVTAYGPEYTPKNMKPAYKIAYKDEIDAAKETDGFKKRRDSMWRAPVAAMKKRKKAMDSAISAQMRARKAKKEKIEDMTLREVKDKMKSGAKEIKKRIGDTRVGDIKDAYKAINPAERVKSKLRDRMEERRAIARARRKQGKGVYISDDPRVK